MFVVGSCSLVAGCSDDHDSLSSDHTTASALATKPKKRNTRTTRRPADRDPNAATHSAAETYFQAPGLPWLHPGQASSGSAYDADLGAQGPSSLEALPSLSLASPAPEKGKKRTVETNFPKKTRESKKKSKSELASEYKTLYHIHQQSLETTALILSLLRGDIEFTDKPKLEQYTQDKILNLKQDKFLDLLMDKKASSTEWKGGAKKMRKQKVAESIPDHLVRKMYKISALQCHYTRFLQPDCHEKNLDKNLLEFLITQTMLFNTGYISDLFSLDLDQFDLYQVQDRVAAYQKRIEQIKRYLWHNQASLASMRSFCLTQFQDGELKFTKFMYAVLKELLIIPGSTEAVWYRELSRTAHEVTIRGNTKDPMYWLDDNQLFFRDFFKKSDVKEDYKNYLSSIARLDTQIKEITHLIENRQDALAEEMIISIEKNFNLCIGDSGLIVLDQKESMPVFSIYYLKDWVHNGEVDPVIWLLKLYYLALQDYKDYVIMKSGLESGLIHLFSSFFTEEPYGQPTHENPWFAIYKVFLLRHFSALKKQGKSKEIIKAAYQLADQSLEALKKSDKEEEAKLMNEKAQVILTQPTAKKKQKSALTQKPIAQEANPEKPILEETPVEQPIDFATTLKKWVFYIFQEVFSDGFFETKRRIALHYFESIMEVVYYRWCKICKQGVASLVNEEKWVVEEFLKTIQHTLYPHFDKLSPEEQLEKIALKYDLLMNVTPAVLQAVEDVAITQHSQERSLLMGLFACWGSFFQDLHNNKTLQFDLKRPDAIDPAIGQVTQDGWRIQGYSKNDLELIKALLELRECVSHASEHINKLGNKKKYDQYLTKEINYIFQKIKSKNLILLSIGDYCLQRMQERYRSLRDESLASSMAGMQVGNR